MTTEEKLYYNNAEIKNVVKCLYTLAGVANLKETVTINDLNGNYGGYDSNELHEIAARVFYLEETGILTSRNMTREHLRQYAALLTAQAAVRRGFVVAGNNQ